MPRPARHNIHRHFESVPRGPEKVPRVSCRYCSHAMKKDVSRMAKHLMVCTQYKQWAAENGGEEPDLQLPQSSSVGRESTGGPGSNDMFLQQQQQQQQQQQHHQTPSQHRGGAGAGTGGTTDPSPHSAALLASLQGTMHGRGGPPGASGADTGVHGHGPPQQSQQHQQTPQHQQHAPTHSMLPPPPPPHPMTPSMFSSSSAAGQITSPQPLQTNPGSHAHQPPPTPVMDQSKAILDPTAKRKLDVMYARAIVSEGNQFNLYDQKNHPNMFAFLKALNAHYEPPDRRVLGNLLMDEFFSKDNWS